MTNARRILCIAMLGVSLAAIGAPPLSAETQWGTSLPASKTVNAWQFAPASSNITWSIASNLHRYGTSGGAFYASLDLPDGALILSMELEACDTTAASSVLAHLYRSTTAGYANLADVQSGHDQVPGCARFFVELLTPETVDNDTYTYQIAVNSGSSSQTTFGAVRVNYQLQVSPAPPAPTFNDVPESDPGFQYIEALVASGITAGCGSNNFCPDATLTRRQMAVFLAKALGLNWPEVSNLRGAGGR